MLGYLKKFNNLPAELRQKVTNPEAMAAIEELEKKYRLPLASFVMRVMVKEIAFKDLASFLLKENLTAVAAGQLVEELKVKIFFSLGNYLSPPVRPCLPAGRQAGPPAAPKPERSGPARSSVPVFQTTPPSAFKPLVQAAGTSEKTLVKGASFFFSPDDEQEIRELAKKIAVAEKAELPASPAGGPAAKIESELKQIIDRAQINFGSADLADRFKQILKIYLRGIRNRLETELTLTKPFASGGLSFDEDSARKVMAMADKIVNPVKSQSEIGTQSVFNGVNSKPDSPNRPADEIITLSSKTRLAELERIKAAKLIVERDTAYDFSKLDKARKSSGLIGQELKDVSHELAPLTPAVAPIKPKFAASPVRKKEPFLNKIDNQVAAPARPAQAKTKRGGEPDLSTLPTCLPDRQAGRQVGQTGLTAPAGGTSQMPLIRRRFEAENLSQNQKVKVEDVKYVPRVMSPLDEIKYLDLVNFRRLDKDPLAAALKIKSKINLLEEEGYGKKLEGVKLWRSSPLNGLYLEIGHLSISGNKPVDVIIEERKIETRDYLTAAEFKAIMDLNKSLRF